MFPIVKIGFYVAGLILLLSGHKLQIIGDGEGEKSATVVGWIFTILAMVCAIVPSVFG